PPRSFPSDAWCSGSIERNAPRYHVVPAPMLRRTWLLSVVALGCEPATHASIGPIATGEATASGETYSARRARIANLRDGLAAELEGATSESSARAIVERARRALRSAIVDTLFPAWLGTDWSFDGTTEEPRGPGGIACGYFVATILQHAGVRLESRRKF